MRADAENNMRLMAVFGPILIDISEKLLIDRGILAKPSFVYAKYAPHPKLRKTSPWQRAYQLGIVEAPDRNTKIVDFAKKAVEHGLQVMVLALHVAHGVALKKLLDPVGKTQFLRGADKQSERKGALNKLKVGKIDILIGTTILDVGVDVPSVGMIILAGGGKAEVALRQRIGRGMRAKKKGENVVFIVDFEDGLNSHLSDHAKQRRAIVEGTPGFDVGITAEQDFDWSVFSSRKTA
jgi:superfamily II DNA or RNA helicase